MPCRIPRWRHFHYTESGATLCIPSLRPLSLLCSPIENCNKEKERTQDIHTQWHSHSRHRSRSCSLLYRAYFCTKCRVCHCFWRVEEHHLQRMHVNVRHTDTALALGEMKAPAIVHHGGAGARALGACGIPIAAAEALRAGITFLNTIMQERQNAPFPRFDTIFTAVIFTFEEHLRSPWSPP